MFRDHPRISVISRHLCLNIFFSLGSIPATIFPLISLEILVRLELESEVWGNELKLLDSIGTAQMSAQLQGEVAKLVKKHSDKMVNEVGVEPNLSVEDAKQYSDEVMKELNKHRSSK